MSGKYERILNQLKCGRLGVYTANAFAFSEKITGEIKQKRRKSREKRDSKKKRSRYYSEIFSVVLVGRRLFKSLFMLNIWHLQVNKEKRGGRGRRLPEENDQGSYSCVRRCTERCQERCPERTVQQLRHMCMGWSGRRKGSGIFTLYTSRAKGKIFNCKINVSQVVIQEHKE